MRVINAAALVVTPQPVEPMTTIGLARLIQALGAPCECEAGDPLIECQEGPLVRWWREWR